jgi:hypothetical protein
MADTQEGASLNPADAKDTYCPFGCTLEEGNERGYCDHLVGFTTDGKKYEPLKVRTNGDWMVGGMIQSPDGKKKMVPDLRDVPHLKKGKIELINPTENYVDQGIPRMRKIFFSDRLYMADPPEREVYVSPAEKKKEEAEQVNQKIREIATA